MAAPHLVKSNEEFVTGEQNTFATDYLSEGIRPRLYQLPKIDMMTFMTYKPSQPQSSNLLILVSENEERNQNRQGADVFWHEIYENLSNANMLMRKMLFRMTQALTVELEL